MMKEKQRREAEPGWVGAPENSSQPPQHELCGSNIEETESSSTHSSFCYEPVVWDPDEPVDWETDKKFWFSLNLEKIEDISVSSEISFDNLDEEEYLKGLV